MQALLTGIYGRYNTTNTFKTALTGGMYLEMAPQGTNLPYATYSLITGRPDYYFSEMFEIAGIQFDIYAQTNAVRQDLYTKLTALYDDCKPTVTGYTSVIMERTFQHLLRDGTQNEIFRYIVEYSARIEKSR